MLDNLIYINRFSCCFEIIHDIGLLHRRYIGYKLLKEAAGITEVTIDELYNIEPKLSATVITVGVTVRLTSPMTDTEAREELADIPGLESVERFC